MTKIATLAPGDAGWVLQRHAEHYCGGLGFAQDFEMVVAEVLAAFLRDGDPRTDRGWIAWAGGARIGCIFARQLEAKTGQLRLFFVEESERGQGVGQSLLGTLLAHGAGCGWSRMKVWTHAEHVEAGRLYRRNGFVLKGARPVESFGKSMTEEAWEKPLGTG